MNKAVKATTTEVSTNVLDQLHSDADAQAFGEGMDKGALALPFLAILQGLSPQVARGTPQYVQGSAPGMIYNSVTKALADTVAAIVLRRTHTYCFWTPRDSGGGFKGEVPSTEEHDAMFQQLFEQGRKRDPKKPIALTSDGLEMTEHRNFFLLQIPENADARPFPVVISMTKSQLTEARNWNYNITKESVQGNLQSEIWDLGTTMRKKGENQWYVWSVRHRARVDAGTLGFYTEAKAAVPLAAQHQTLARQLEPTTDEDEAL